MSPITMQHPTKEHTMKAHKVVLVHMFNGEATGGQTVKRISTAKGARRVEWDSGPPVRVETEDTFWAGWVAETFAGQVVAEVVT